MGNEYSLQEVAELLGLSIAEVRRCVRAGFLAARCSSTADVTLSFQDLVSLRRAAELVSARIRPHRVRHTLKRLRDQLPEGRHLSSVQMSVEGKSILAHEGETRWNPLSGQMHLNFQSLIGRPSPASPIGRETAETHYEQGCEAENGSVSEAEAAYRKALEVFPGHVPARINLGRLLHEAGNPAGAALEYQAALEQGPNALASFNLGVALEDLLRPQEAIAAYQRAVAADPDCEDAYFNLARIYERQGERAAALRALRTYRNLTSR